MTKAENLITAAEATAISSINDNTDLKEKAEQIYYLIKRAAENGRYNLTILSSIQMDNELIHELKENGFNIFTRMDAHIEKTIISWEKETT